MKITCPNCKAKLTVADPEPAVATKTAKTSKKLPTDRKAMLAEQKAAWKRFNDIQIQLERDAGDEDEENEDDENDESNDSIWA